MHHINFIIVTRHFFCNINNFNQIKKYQEKFDDYKSKNLENKKEDEEKDDKNDEENLEKEKQAILNLGIYYSE